jgi:hypothetical protein
MNMLNRVLCPLNDSMKDPVEIIVNCIKKISEERMKKNIQKAQGSGKSKEVPTEVPEPDQIASGVTVTKLENTTCSGMRGNMILFLADRQDRIVKRLNTKIERIDQRLTILEEREQAK